MEPSSIFAWCLPRTCSTSLMYSFGSRDDTTCVDEPLYASYLVNSPWVYRSYRDRVVCAQETDGNKVVEALLSSGRENSLFAKMMSKHIKGVDVQPLLETGFHILLFRDPTSQLASYAEQEKAGVVGTVTLEETGFPDLVAIYSQLRGLGKGNYVLVSSEQLTTDPKKVLENVCRRAGIPFQEAMLQWDKGPKPYDGLWANEWYNKVHDSSGFTRDDDSSMTFGGKKKSPFPPGLVALLREVGPFYDLLEEAMMSSTMPSSSSSLLAARNHDILVFVGAPGRGRLVPRHSAAVSVFDSAVQGGDACWEGLRVYKGRVFALESHLERLADSARILDFFFRGNGRRRGGGGNNNDGEEETSNRCHSLDEIRRALFLTLRANGMVDEAHVRLTLTRGRKVTSSMNPKFNVFGTTLIVLAERKPVVSEATYDNRGGVDLAVSSVRRNSPSTLDSKIHHANLLNNILAKIEANARDAADALMLDVDGYVAETNGTNVFLVKRGTVKTPAPDHCLPGITRGLVVDLCRRIGLVCDDSGRLSLADFLCADEVFTTGTMGELTPVVSIEKRPIGDGTPGPVTAKIQHAFTDLTQQERFSTPIPGI